MHWNGRVFIEGDNVEDVYGILARNCIPGHDVLEGKVECGVDIIVFLFAGRLAFPSLSNFPKAPEEPKVLF